MPFKSAKFQLNDLPEEAGDQGNDLLMEAQKIVPSSR
jgi:hypothetical protein